ncbi:hypothetical protein GF367_00740 [Candidatus Woesearchaeota archaeon]|nr:hypothetical protein [Candidatus Woesearchaeota archaeon]
MGGQQERARALLQGLTKKRHIIFVEKGNAAIKQALRLAKERGRTALLIPDQGGWLTYPRFGKQLGFTVKEILTDRSYITPEMIQGDATTVLLLNSMPAYAFTIPVADIAKKCEEKNVLFINDVSATIGAPEATYGDIIIGSCNRWKPLPLGKGGFIATDYFLEQEEPSLDYAKLVQLLETLPERCTKAFHAANKLKLFLEKYDIIRSDHKGYNVIVACKEEEKERLINLVKDFDASIEHTDCPRYIRVLEPGISFEIKRRFNDGV